MSGHRKMDQESPSSSTNGSRNHRLRIRLAATDSSEPRAKKCTKDYAKEYRDKLKDNPVLYARHRHEENLRNKDYRSKMTEEAKLWSNELQRRRQQKYRDRQKAKGASMPLSEQHDVETSVEVPKSSKTRKAINTRKTRKGVVQQRVKWRDGKQKYREKMNHQKKEAICKKRREQYAAKKRQARSRKDALDQQMESNGSVATKHAITRTT